MGRAARRFIASLANSVKSGCHGGCAHPEQLVSDTRTANLDQMAELSLLHHLHLDSTFADSLWVKGAWPDWRRSTGPGQETAAQLAAHHAQLRSEWHVRITLVQTGERFPSQVQPAKTTKNQWTLRPTTAMKAAFNKQVPRDAIRRIAVLDPGPSHDLRRRPLES